MTHKNLLSECFEDINKRCDDLESVTLNTARFAFLLGWRNAEAAHDVFKYSSVSDILNEFRASQFSKEPE